nr:alcohol dehydrogenase catalytic domain-containing protein [Gordonia spumicola]
MLVDVHFAGLCRSDLHEIEGIWPATCPTVLGHEASVWCDVSATGCVRCGPATTSSPV